MFLHVLSHFSKSHVLQCQNMPCCLVLWNRFGHSLQSFVSTYVQIVLKLQHGSVYPTLSECVSGRVNTREDFCKNLFGQNSTNVTALCQHPSFPSARFLDMLHARSSPDTTGQEKTAQYQRPRPSSQTEQFIYMNAMFKVSLIVQCLICFI